MTPLINGKVHHFEWRGLYDGISILLDRETGSLWHHVTGEALYGPLAGTKLPVSNLVHTTVEQALKTYPDLQVAISDRPITGKHGRWSPWLAKIPILGKGFHDTMAREDTRRPEMDVGLGIWTSHTSWFYPLELVQAAGSIVLDELDGRRVLVYFQPEARALTAFYVNVTSATWEGSALRLSSGAVIRDDVLYDRDGNRHSMERPMQLFTRWYGYALTFPETEIYEPER